MNAVITFASGYEGKTPEVGDIIKFLVFIDQKIGGAGDGWEIASDSGMAWVPAGSVTAAVASVRSLPADGNATKLEFEAMVHQPGALVVGPLLMRNQVTKDEIEISANHIAGKTVTAGTKPPEEPPWVLGGSPFGSWDWMTIAVLFALLLLASGLSIRYGLRRLREHLTKNLTNTERALHALANLQKYARSKKPLQLDEWKKFSFELAGILRRFSDSNFSIDSRDMTDREFLQELRANSNAAPFLNLLGGILATITEVRYGRKELDASVVPGLLLDARKFVESTSTEPKKGEESK